MIKLTPVLQQILFAPTVSSAFLVKIGDTLKITDAPFDFQLMNGGSVFETYLSDGRLISLEPPAIDSAVDQSNYTITIADPSFEDGNAVEAEWISSKIDVRMVFFNSSGADMVDSNSTLVKPDEPFKQIADTLIVYSGVIDTASYDVDTSELGEVILTLTCASPMYNLDATRTYLLNKDFSRTINPYDTAYDQVYKASVNISLIWGKQ